PPPRPHRSIGFHRNRVGASGRYGSNSGEARNLRWASSFRRRPIAQLATTINAPCPYRPILTKRHGGSRTKGVSLTRSHLLGACSTYGQEHKKKHGGSKLSKLHQRIRR